MDLSVREAGRGDLPELMRLYTYLHGEPVPEELPWDAWEEILRDPRQHVLLVEQEGQAVSSCTVTIVPNLTHAQRPYALVENVVTVERFRGRGYATACLNRAREIAQECGCYKISLMTGSKRESTLRFYERAGYLRGEKTAFVQWLDRTEK